MKCTVKGEYSHTTHTVVFPKLDCPKRNDADFRAKKYGGHHKTDSPLLELPIDMVEQFIVADSLHLIDLGIMKRLLTGWRDGNFGKKDTKWCARDINMISTFLLHCKMPKEIHRAVRGIDVLAHWKGSEFRTFLYYLSIIILQKIMNEHCYHHFLCFFCAITICSNENYFIFLDLADALLVSFVQNFKKYYGDGYITSNMHNLIHLVDEVRRFGILQSFSAYPFENKLYCLKRKIRHGNKPLEQIARRICEQNRIELKQSNGNDSNLTYPCLECNLKSGSVLRFESYIFTIKEPDNFLLTKENQIVQITGMKLDNGTIMIEGNCIENLDNVFENPINSSMLNISKCSVPATTTNLIINVDFIKSKLVCICYGGEWFFIPLLHSIN